MGLEQVRLDLLAQHEVLRERLFEISALLDEMADGDRTVSLQLKALAQRFASAFLSHVEQEERLLEPLLPTIDAWGPERLAYLKEEHGHQRQLLASFQARIAYVQSSQRLAEVIQALISSVLVDMDNEEADLLTPDLFRDDAIVIDQMAG